MAAWHEASGADPEYLPTDRPSAVSGNGGDESRLRKRTCRQRYQGLVGSLVRPESVRSWLCAQRCNRPNLLVSGWAEG